MFGLFNRPGEPEQDRNDHEDEDVDNENERIDVHLQSTRGELYDHMEENIRPFIDLIDNLRRIGIQRDIDMSLPTIVVIGDQSSGKSSVLEALSGVALPRGSGIVTRCPLELKLKKVTDGTNWKGTLSYRIKQFNVENSSVGSGRREVDVSYKKKIFDLHKPWLVEECVKEAQNELAGEGAGISDELITLEIRSADVCDLTLIDLPGIARVPVQGQQRDIGDQIKTLIMKYIRKPETLNMVVVPCNVDIATTEALQMAQDVDPQGTRTVAVLTKPDLIDRGTEREVMAIAQNEVIRLSKGYIMVKCRGQHQIDDNIPLKKAIEMEREFFQNHEYFRNLLTSNKATIPHLATELTEHLVNHITQLLPQLDEEIQMQLTKLRSELNQFAGGPPQDPQGARLFFIETLSGFNDKIKHLSLGELIIRENLFIQLRNEYKKWNSHLKNKMSSLNQSEMKNQILKKRGRELAGFSSYRTFEMILQEHATQLKEPAVALINTMKGIIHKQFSDVATKCFQRYPALLRATLNKIEHIQSSQQIKAEERMQEQFEMENLIFTQDTNFFVGLNKNGIESFSEAQLPFCDVASKYSDMLKAYYEIMVQRMADQVPMVAQYFMLREAATLLRNDMLRLLDEEDVREMLTENSDVNRKRNDLRARLERLSTAQQEINRFI